MDLKGQHVLIVEDEFFIAMDLAETVRDAGAEVIGPAASVREALDLIGGTTVTVAVLDINLGKETSLAIATRLEKDRIPFVYHSGQTFILASSDWPEAPIISKPALPAVFVKAIATALSD